MNPANIIYRYVWFLIIFSLLVFGAGLIETTRNESMTIGENILLNVTNTSSNAWNNYTEFKSGYIFTNEPLILFLNFMGSVGFLYLIRYSWKTGRDYLPLELEEIFTSFSIFLILILYVMGIVLDYFIHIFVDQLIVVLFEEIYTSVYMYQLLINWYWGFILLSLFLVWLSNQIKYFEIHTQK